jgi:hypothetical protein
MSGVVEPYRHSLKIRRDALLFKASEWVVFVIFVTCRPEHQSARDLLCLFTVCSVHFQLHQSNVIICLNRGHFHSSTVRINESALTFCDI